MRLSARAHELSYCRCSGRQSSDNIHRAARPQPPKAEAFTFAAPGQKRELRGRGRGGCFHYDGAGGCGGVAGGVGRDVVDGVGGPLLMCR